MPAYKKTKPVTAEKILEQSRDEIAQQKAYARRRHAEETAGTGPSTKRKGEKLRRKAAYERVDPSLAKGGVNRSGTYASITGETLEKVRRIAEKAKERYGQFKDLGE